MPLLLLLQLLLLLLHDYYYDIDDYDDILFTWLLLCFDNLYIIYIIYIFGKMRDNSCEVIVRESFFFFFRLWLPVWLPMKDKKEEQKSHLQTSHNLQTQLLLYYD